MPITPPSRGSGPPSRPPRAFRRRSPRVISLPPLPLATERPPRCVWDTKPVLPHQEDVPVSNTSPQDNHLLRVVLLLRKRSLVQIQYGPRYFLKTLSSVQGSDRSQPPGVLARRCWSEHLTW